MRARGISLIELLVVIAILAVLAAAVLLSTDLAGGARHAEREARRLATIVELACERAELSGGEYGMHFSRTAYSVSQLKPEGWIMEKDNALERHELPAGFTLDVARDGETLELGKDVSEKPVSACHPSGEIAPFRATLRLGGAARYTIAGDIDGKVTVDAVPPSA